MSQKVIFPRSVAVRVLTRVLSDRVPLDVALTDLSKEVPSNSVGWLQEVCSGTLRWKGRLDFILDSVALKKKPSGWLRKVLLLAVYQLLVQENTHPGKVVSETVTEVKNREGHAPAQFANACLRKIADHVPEWKKQTMPSDQASSEASFWMSLPPWLWNRLLKDYGLEWSTSYALASLERPKLWIKSREPQAPFEGVVEGPVPGSWFVQEGGPVTDLPGFREGKWIVQDISSQFIGHKIAQRVKESQSGEPIKALDLCAAPGGKSVGMAWNGFQVIATDRVKERVPLLQDTFSRVATQVQYLPWDDIPTLEPQDLVWVDAPCSGTGILRRHPDVRWLRQEKEIAALVEIQRDLLKMAWEKVKSGGFLAYSVCSVLKEEGPEALIKTGLEEFKIEEWFLCPQESPHGDGFWAALLRKK